MSVNYAINACIKCGNWSNEMGRPLGLAQDLPSFTNLFTLYTSMRMVIV